jgi:hypothetical protein
LKKRVLRLNWLLIIIKLLDIHSYSTVFSNLIESNGSNSLFPFFLF